MSETPQDFDFDKWLEGAERPARTVTVYQKAGLIADLDVLAEQITNAEQDDEVDGPSMGGGVGSLRARYAELAQQFHDSALHIRVESLTKEDQRDIGKANPDLEPGDLGYLILSEAIASPKLSVSNIKKLERVLGDAQFNRLLVAYRQACNEVLEPSADFLPKPSTRGDGGE